MAASTKKVKWVGQRVEVPGEIFHDSTRSWPGSITGMVKSSAPAKKNCVYVKLDEDSGTEYWFKKKDVVNWIMDETAREVLTVELNQPRRPGRRPSQRKADSHTESSVNHDYSLSSSLRLHASPVPEDEVTNPTIDPQTPEVTPDRLTHPEAEQQSRSQYIRRFGSWVTSRMRLGDGYNGSNDANEGEPEPEADEDVVGDKSGEIEEEVDRMGREGWFASWFGGKGQNGSGLVEDVGLRDWRSKSWEGVEASPLGVSMGGEMRYRKLPDRPRLWMLNDPPSPSKSHSRSQADLPRDPISGRFAVKAPKGPRSSHPAPYFDSDSHHTPARSERSTQSRRSRRSRASEVTSEVTSGGSQFGDFTIKWGFVEVTAACVLVAIWGATVYYGMQQSMIE